MMTASWPRPALRVAVVGRFLLPAIEDEVVLAFAAAICADPAALTVVVHTACDDAIDYETRRRHVADLVPSAACVEARMPGEVIGAPGAAAGVRGVSQRDVPVDLARALRDRADALVGSAPGRLDLARQLGLQYIPVDVPAETPPATVASGRTLWGWHALPADSRAGHARPVVIMGPESTGKTTLARDLARHFGTAWTSEYLRVWLDAKGAVCEPHDLPYVVAGHRASEAALARHAQRVLFCDCDPLMTAVYSRFYYGDLPVWLDEAASARRAGLYLLLDCDVPWVPDPQRDMPHRREDIRDLCREELQRRHLPWTLVGGTWTGRFETARESVERLLERPARAGV
jgi:nicotinamide riboside kinase